MKIEINKKAYEKLQKKLPWLYANEIDVNKSGLANLYYKGEYVATAFVNPNSKISARILSFKKERVDKEFFYKKIKKAILKREALKSITNSYRLIHSEADFLPGLIVDKYEDNLIVSFTTFGMDSYKEIIVDILIELVNPKGIYEKGDKIREKEGLEVVSKELYGEVDDEFIIKE
ncbi:MAG TPA: class I SAM-dependent rRNA methyltransferase, partial [Nautiliaceae bacterium]|nr:class I SAM-dependent rRNA methyltransferase [Nautiliaceae bacterium]